MTKIIAFFNQAGGVGKSTLVQNLGYAIAKRQHRVLLIDVDPQASLTTFMGLEPGELEQTIYNSLVSEEDPAQLPIHQQFYDLNLDLIPSNILLANAEQELMFAEMREMRLKDTIAPTVSNYDFIFLDCPPSLGILSLISLVTATHILVPIQCQFKALKGTDSLLATIAKVRRKLNKSLQLAGFFPTMYQSGNSLDRQTLASIREQLSPIGTIFTPLPRATAIAEAALHGQPLALSPKKNKALELVFERVAVALEKL